MSRPLCIYHGNCADGFTAAWVVRRYFAGDVDFHAGVYQNPPPEVTGRDVILVDFSYKADVLHEMAGHANSILVLDHHKSAAEDLLFAGEAASGWEQHLLKVDRDKAAGVTHRLYALFDMERSGAGIAWDWFFAHRNRPRLIDHIEDRDLWRFALPGTREIQACIFSHSYDFDTWDLLMSSDLGTLHREGEAIERKHHKDIAELLGVVTRRMVIGGHNVPVANLPYTLASDAGHKLAQGEPFAGCYWDTPDGRVFSLRSTENGLDVSAIAKQYGGGGHRNAAGFRVSYDKAREFEVAQIIRATHDHDLCERAAIARAEGRSDE